MAEVDTMTGKDASGTAREFPTLKPLIERIGALTAPAAGSVNAQLAALLAALAALATNAKQDTAAAILALIGTRAYGTTERVLVNASGAATAAGIAATEVMLHATVRCFVKAGGGSPAATSTDSIPLEAGEKFHMRITSGHKIAVIRESTDGYLYVTPVTP